MFKASSLTPTAFFFLIIVLTFLVYWPGLQGGFLFDDYPNLQELSTYGGVVDFNSLKAFVFGGFAGPTGRPLSLLSFLLNDNSWPSHAFSFKLTNLWIHLLVGLVLCWSTLLLLRFYGLTEQSAVWAAVISAAIWLLHPYFVSTTLYVVQRMTQLATLFMLAGLAGYLHGRLLLLGRPRASYLWMTVSVGLGTLLAVLSKENGALLPLLIIVVEFCRPKSAIPAPAKVWSFFVLWLPSLVVVGALARMIDFSPDLWPIRNFDQPERLFSESRIVWEYLFHLYIPQIEGRGLFQDGYEISRGWMSPSSTVFAVIGIFGLLGAAFLLRRPWPFFSLAILFFFASHLMESTVVGLELYFEHRNYVSAAFLFLPVALGVVHLAAKFQPKVPITVTCALLGVLVLMTAQRTSLWSDTENLSLYWAVSTPSSPRAQNSIANYMLKHGREDEVDAFVEKAIARLPDSGLLSTRLLLQKVYAGSAEQADFALTSSRLAAQPFDSQAVQGLRSLVDKVVEPGVNPSYSGFTIELLDAVNTNIKYQRLPVFQRLAPYLKARLYLAQHNPEAAFAEYSLSMARYSETEAGLMMVAELARSGYQEYALRLLPQAQAIYRDQPRRTLRRTSGEYDDEFARLEADLRADIAAMKPAGSAN